MRLRLEIDLPIPTPRRSRRLTLALIVALAVTVPGIVLASHQFADVPDSNQFHADIDALVDAGVTSGCGGGNYCPSANVTRDQMAAFLNRLGALSPTKTPVVNAAKLDGLEGADLVAGTATIPSGQTVTGHEYVFDAGLANDAFGIAFIPFPGRVPSVLYTAYVNFAPGANVGDPDASCTGSPGAPTAPAGRVCIYLDGYAYADNMTGATPDGGGNAFTDRGFVVTYQANNPTAGQPVGISFSWAYTAP